MRERRVSPTAVLAGVVAILTLLLAMLLADLLARGGGESGAVPGAIALADRIPVGVVRSPAGALAAADNYLALASQSIEQAPQTFAELVAQVYAAPLRTQTLAQAERLRVSDTQNMANYQQGGRAIAVIAARRLDSYSSNLATVTTWLGGFTWGPDLAPRQSWSLVDTTLRWQGGRWLVVSCDTDSTPAPVPSIVYVTAGNDRSPAFARLAGMSTPSYGAAG